MKLYTNKLDHPLYYFPAIVREYVQANNIETVVVSEEQQASDDFKVKRAHGKFPMLELDDGSMIFESAAIAFYIARQSASHGGALVGHNAFEEAQVNQWVLANAGNWAHAGAIMYNTLGMMYNMDAYNAAVKGIKEQAKKLNDHLEGKTFLVGQRLTIADIATFLPMSMAFAFVLDAGFRKAMPNVSDWFARVAAQSCVINAAGVRKMCEKPIKPVDFTKMTEVKFIKPTENQFSEAVEVVAVADAEDDFDPFASQSEEDEEAEKEKQARFKELAKTAKSYGKKAAVAKSIIIWEVKPWGEETDIDEMAKMILAIEMDGLFWKTEYKKEPIAYGVFKIIIGATIEDDKVSTDDVQEKIEAMEEMVQSVDIQAFNKL